MSVRKAATELPRPSAGLDRDLVKRTRAETLERPEAGRGRARRFLEVARLRCNKGGPVIDGVECSHCRRFINASPADDMDSLEVRCLWSTDDVVGDLMTFANAIVSVAPTTTLSEARALLRQHNIKQLLVIDDSPPEQAGDGAHIVGQITRAELADAEHSTETVGSRMWIAPEVLPPFASVADAVDVFARTPVDCFPVVDKGRLVGLLTRGDLIRVGVPTDLLQG